MDKEHTATEQQIAQIQAQIQERANMLVAADSQCARLFGQLDILKQLDIPSETEINPIPGDS